MKFGSESGSALVLTLLFIMLLTTMSTAMYLYSTKQSLYADSEYTTVAASYVADAGLEHGKALLARQDPMLNTYGQNPGDNVLDRDDYPVILPMSAELGEFETNSMGERITDGKQGVGNYSLRIDAAFAEIVDFDIQLQRTTGFAPSDLSFGLPARLNRLLPGKILQMQIRQGIEVVNAYKLSYLSDDVFFGQTSGTLNYQLDMTNIINPFLGEPITLEINRTRILADTFTDTPRNIRDAWGNSLVLFPNDWDTRNYEKLITSNKTGTDALFFTAEPNKALAAYILEIENLDPSSQTDLQVTLIYRDQTTGIVGSTIIGGIWTGGPKHFALLDFSNDGGLCKDWRLDNITPHPIVGSGPTLNDTSIIMEVTSTDWFSGAHISLTRGIPGDINLGLQMRCEGMPEGCWFPQYPDCGSASGYQPMMTLAADQESILYDMTREMMNLGHKAKLRVNELYTISATGNVESASETRTLLVSPSSFLDYARFSMANRIRLEAGSMVGGRLYSVGRIELPSTVYFYDDVYTSDLVVNPANAQFLRDGQLHENVALIEFPAYNSIETFYNANAGKAWVIGTPFSSTHYDLFLGNYGHVNTQASSEFYGFDFSESGPVYREPGGNIMNSDNYSYRTGWSPGALGPPTTMLSEDFNGLIIVNGNVHIWGKLHGRSLTIFARGDIYIEREVLMGTDELDPASPEEAMSTSEGMPVHLALVALKGDSFGDYTGDILLSENCPRIMTVQASLLAFAGTLSCEDDDAAGSVPADIDADKSHKFARYQWIDALNVYDWQYTNASPLAGWDLNNDGRLSDAQDFVVGELPRIELGDWNENQLAFDDQVWYLQVIGSYISYTSGGPRHYTARGMMTGTGRNGNTTNYRYDPSIRINAPPLLPVPNNALRILEWDHALYN